MVTSFCEKRKRAKTYLEGAWVELTESYFLTDVLVWPNRVNYYDLFIPLLGISALQNYTSFTERQDRREPRAPQRRWRAEVAGPAC